MIDKYLPIGTVCTLKGNNKKTMIVGFFSVEYNGNIKMYDYQGCAYPEGLLLNNRLVNFNHNDIEKIDFLGYKDTLHDNFNKLLLQNTKQLDVGDPKLTTVSNFQFDENGVVIFDGTVSQEKEVKTNPLESAVQINNPFNREYKPENKVVNPNRQEILSPYVFDENGIIIAENHIDNKDNTNINNTTDSPYIFNENGVIVGEKGKEEANSKYQFDKNGVVVSDGTASIENSTSDEASTTDSPYIFNENGVIVGEKGKEETNSKYQFDKNGVVVSDSASSIENSTSDEASTTDSPYIFNENGVIVGEKGKEETNSKYQFDENGIVVSDE